MIRVVIAQGKEERKWKAAFNFSFLVGLLVKSLNKIFAELNEQ